MLVLKHLFNNIRDVTRYVNVLRFSFQMVRGEVYFIELLPVTAFQVFLPEVYYGVRDNKDLFSGTLQSGLGHGDSEKQQAKQQCDEIISRTSHLDKKFVEDLLTKNVPKLEASDGRMVYGNESLSVWRTNCRICSPDLFDIYFRLQIPKGELSQKEIDTILSLAVNREGFSVALQNLNKDGRIIRFLIDLRILHEREYRKHTLKTLYVA